MAEEPARGGGRVDRRILVDGAGRQAIGQHLGGGARAAGHEDGGVRTGGAQLAGERQERGALAKARAMQPDEAAGWSGRAGAAQALA